MTLTGGPHEPYDPHVDEQTPAPVPQAWTPGSYPQAHGLQVPLSRGERLKRALGPVGALLAGLAKFGAVLFKLKAFVVVGSMLVSLGAYALAFGWQFALGFVLLIFVHEMGHVIVLRLRGIKAGLPVFLPFLGAFVQMKESPRTAYDEALSGIAGPVFGTVAAFGALGLAESYDSDLLRAIAYTGFFLNLFNLLPVLPLDGGRTAAALSPKLWVVGFVALLGYEVWRPSPVIPLILVIGGFELYRRWKGRDSETSKTYYALTSQQRTTIATAYVGLVAVILWAMHTFPVPDR